MKGQSCYHTVDEPEAGSHSYILSVSHWSKYFMRRHSEMVNNTLSSTKCMFKHCIYQQTRSVLYSALLFIGLNYAWCPSFSLFTESHVNSGIWCTSPCKQTLIFKSCFSSTIMGWASISLRCLVEGGTSTVPKPQFPMCRASSGVYSFRIHFCLRWSTAQLSKDVCSIQHLHTSLNWNFGGLQTSFSIKLCATCYKTTSSSNKIPSRMQQMNEMASLTHESEKIYKNIRKHEI